MYLHPLSVAALSLGLALAQTLTPALAPAAQAAMHYEETTQAYDIGAVGGDPASIWEAIRRYGPDSAGRQRPGATEGNIRWTPSIERGSLCRVQRVDVTVTVTTSLPAWSTRHRASRKLQNYWDCLAKAAASHEKTHAQVWKNTGYKIDRELNAITDSMPCGDLDDALREKAQTIQSAARERHAAIDQDGRNKRFEACDTEFKKPAAVADTKEESPSVETAESADASPEAGGDTPKPARLGARIRAASGNVVQATGTSMSLMLWIGGLLVAGMAAFIILMKTWLTNGDEEVVETFKDRSALLRMARRVDASTGGFVKRSSLPDKMGIRRRPQRIR